MPKCLLKSPTESMHSLQTKRIMSPLKFMTSFLYLLTFISLLQTVLAFSIYDDCSYDKNFTSNDPYERHLRELLSHFYHEIGPMGFVLGSKGHGDNQIHGLAMCNIGISASDCSICIANATENIRHKCPYGKVGLSCHDDCLLRYSNNNFFGKVENETVSLANWLSVHGLASFNRKRLELMRNISNEAYQTPKMYATGELEVDGNVTLYASAQCTKDLSSYSCFMCLDNAISLLVQDLFYWKQGLRVYAESCRIRYEMYKFFSN